MLLELKSTKSQRRCSTLNMYFHYHLPFLSLTLSPERMPFMCPNTSQYGFLNGSNVKNIFCSAISGTNLWYNNNLFSVMLSLLWRESKGFNISWCLFYLSFKFWFSAYKLLITDLQVIPYLVIKFVAWSTLAKWLYANFICWSILVLDALMYTKTL